MIIDHVGVAFFPSVMELRILGRIAMPLYAWCIVVGSEYTHSTPIDMRFEAVYVLGVISQPFYVMALYNTWSDLNILFLFFLGVLAIEGIKKKRWGSQYWAPALCIILLQYINVDYGLNGFLFISSYLYSVRRSKSAIAAAISGGYRLLGFAISFPHILNILGLRTCPFWTTPYSVPGVQSMFFRMQGFHVDGAAVYSRSKTRTKSAACQNGSVTACTRCTLLCLDTCRAYCWA